MPEEPVSNTPTKETAPIKVFTIRDWKEYVGESLLIIFSVLLALALTEWFNKLHEKSETHFLLRGSHLFENNDTGERFDVQAGGYFYLPGHIVHEAWVPVGSQAIIILEDGWKVDWVDGPPSAKDVGLGAP